MTVLSSGAPMLLKMTIGIVLSTSRLSSVGAFVNPVTTARSLASTPFAFQHFASVNGEAQQGRTKGKDRTQELATLATNLKLDSTQLKKALRQRRSKMEDGTEKARYIDWLLLDTDAPQNTAKNLPRSEPKRESIKAKASQTKKPDNNITVTKKKKEKSSSPSFLTTQNFADLPGLHPASKRAITEVLGLSSMTEIQAKTFEAASSGTDVLGRARTGTGKTLAFLVPALERILQQPKEHLQERVGCLIISPTRELATQIGDQAESLLTFHPDLSVQVVFGGTKINRDINQFQRRLPTILVATPGRLLDHLQSTIVHGEKFGRDIMRHTPVVVLDETDRLLDMGFRREIGKILSFLPSQDKRQTLLFSATIPKELKGIMAENMKRDFIEVDCINDAADDTHNSDKIEQSHVVVPTMDRYVSSVVEIVRLAIQQDPEAKIVAFFPTARMVAFYAELFNEGLKLPVIELHSKKTQSYRNRASEQFRSAKSAILFTSDVSARGVDYPGVSQVIQFGMPDNREQYVHRLGRTGRGGATGKGWLVLGPFESLFLQELKGVNIPRNDELLDLLESPMEPKTDEMFTDATDKIRNSKKRQASAKGAYQAFLGFYLGKMKRITARDKSELVALANAFSGHMGLPEVPGLTKNMVGKMGLKGVEGITIKAALPDEDKSSNRSQRHRAGGGASPRNQSNQTRRPRNSRRRG